MASLAGAGGERVGQPGTVVRLTWDAPAGAASGGDYAGVTAGSVAVTVTDDDEAPSLSISSPSVAEGAGDATATLTFEVTLSAASGRTVTVSYAEDTGTATQGADYEALTGDTLTLAQGDRSKTIGVTVKGDDLDESDETVVVQLSSPTNATISTGTGTGTITDDDAAPTLSISSPLGAEGDDGETSTLTFSAVLDRASGKRVTVDYAERRGGVRGYRKVRINGADQVLT